MHDQKLHKKSILLNIKYFINFYKFKEFYQIP